MKKFVKAAIKNSAKQFCVFMGTLTNRAEAVIKSKCDEPMMPDYEKVSDNVERIWGIDGQENDGITKTVQVFRLSGYCSGLAFGMAILIRYYVGHPILFTITAMGTITMLIMTYGKRGESA